MSKRLLVAVPYLPPDPKSGGAEMFVVAMVRMLAADYGWQVSVVTTRPHGGCGEEVMPSGVAVYRLPYKFKLSNSPLSPGWSRMLRRIVADVNPDVLNVHMPVPGIGDMASRLSGGRPVVVHYHFGSMKKGNPLLDPIIWAYESLVLPPTLRTARHIVCGSQYVRNGILHGHRGKTSVISPGVDVERFHPATARVTRPHVLYVGSLNSSDKHKRVTDLLHACKILREDVPDVHLSVVGGGDGRRLYEGLAARLGIRRCVDFHGRLEGDALAEAYRRAAVLAVPSLRETFGMVITEAMASGLPVVAVNGGGVPSVVDAFKDGLLVPGRDPRAMADALRVILSDAATATAMGRAGRRKMRTALGWPGQVAAINSIFERAAGLTTAT